MDTIELTTYREYNPYTEAILPGKDGTLIVIDRYDVNDYGAWWTDPEHLYDDTFGASVRGTLANILHEIRNDMEV